MHRLFQFAPVLWKPTLSVPLRELPASTNHGVQTSKESEGSKASGALTPKLTGMTLHQQVSTRGEGRCRQGGGVQKGGHTRHIYGPPSSEPIREPGLCVSVDVTSSLGGMWAWVSPDPGGSHRDVKPEDVMGGVGASRWSCQWAEQRNTVRAGFRCLPSNCH